MSGHFADHHNFAMQMSNRHHLGHNGRSNHGFHNSQLSKSHSAHHHHHHRHHYPQHGLVHQHIPKGSMHIHNSSSHFGFDTPQHKHHKINFIDQHPRTSSSIIPGHKRDNRTLTRSEPVKEPKHRRKNRPGGLFGNLFHRGPSISVPQGLFSGIGRLLQENGEDPGGMLQQRFGGGGVGDIGNAAFEANIGSNFQDIFSGNLGDIANGGLGDIMGGGGFGDIAGGSGLGDMLGGIGDLF